MHKGLPLLEETESKATRSVQTPQGAASATATAVSAASAWQQKEQQPWVYFTPLWLALGAWRGESESKPLRRNTMQQAKRDGDRQGFTDASSTPPLCLSPDSLKEMLLPVSSGGSHAGPCLKASAAAATAAAATAAALIAPRCCCLSRESSSCLFCSNLIRRQHPPVCKACNSSSSSKRDRSCSNACKADSAAAAAAAAVAAAYMPHLNDAAERIEEEEKGEPAFPVADIPQTERETHE
ncbi:hypothetical protein Emag_007327 [Eimeria magna]